MMITKKTTALAYRLLNSYSMPGTVLSSLHSYSFNFINNLVKLVLLSRTGALERLSILFKDTLDMSRDLISKLMLLSTAVLFLLF